MTIIDTRTGISPDAAEVVRSARSASRIRPLRVSLILAVLTFTAFCVSVSVGDYQIPLRDVVPAMLGYGDAIDVLVAQDLRLPRAVAGLLVGVAFGLSGAIFQAVARNPLASPDILGVTQGSAAVAVFVITSWGAGFLNLYVGAYAGALVIATAIYILAYRDGVSPYRFVLVGIGLGAMAYACTSYLMIRAELWDATAATVWLTGSLNAVGWETVVPTSVIVLILAPTTLVLASRLRGLQLGDDTSKGLGVTVERSRLLVLFAAVGLAGAGTAAAGPIAFVAFMSAPIARRLTKTSLTLIPAALVGALLVLISDVAGRHLFSSAEIPVGVITGMVGAPYLLWLLARANHIGRGG